MKKRRELAVGVLSRIFIIFICCCINTAAEAGKVKSAVVEKIIDGDTIQVHYNSQQIRVRLWGIDTPEYRQPYSKAAKKYSARVLENRSVSLEIKDWDDYGRMVAVVTTADNRCLNEELLKAGLAWVHIYYCKEEICNQWYGYEKEARKKRVGLWRDKSPVPPWEWKQNNRK